MILIVLSLEVSVHKNSASVLAQAAELHCVQLILNILSRISASRFGYGSIFIKSLEPPPPPLLQSKTHLLFISGPAHPQFAANGLDHFLTRLYREYAGFFSHCEILGMQMHKEVWPIRSRPGGGH
jgi:hypothetical protein